MGSNPGYLLKSFLLYQKNLYLVSIWIFANYCFPFISDEIYGSEEYISSDRVSDTRNGDIEGGLGIGSTENAFFGASIFAPVNLIKHKKNVPFIHYGNTGCGVFKQGVQN